MIPRIPTANVASAAANLACAQADISKSQPPAISPRDAFVNEGRSALKAVSDILGGQRPGNTQALEAKRGGALPDFAKIGIIGGMGPAAGNAAAERLVDIFQNEFAVKSDQAHGAYVLVSDSPNIGDRTAYAKDNLPPDLGRRGRDERIKMLTDPRADNPYHGMKGAIDQAASAGAKVAVITCNTAHIWFDALEAHAESKGVKLLHIADSVAEEVNKAMDGKGGRHYPVKIGQLATNGTNSTGLYQNRLASKYPNQFSITVPDEEQQQKTMGSIYGTKNFPVQGGPETNGIKGGEYKNSRDLMLEPAKTLVDGGAQVVTGACTEVPLVINQKDFDAHNVQFVDTLRSLMALAATQAKQMADTDKTALGNELNQHFSQLKTV
ncbi:MULTISPECIES: aspartate/glutamate racemase family protein [Pseudomonas]|uniref:Aspartate/glutamate racemase family protein n=1 Tax=Pseudomonas quercus TaxID=2722792 RepID=A0ABX0YCX2_9PSED|nr:MULTISPECIES: aspartate/glutamate racemase family protein [Pseudomonas]MBF7142214.1 aspartate/glutamate racemase family protein [Pseudomonas sp. LY10J]NJP00752.1 aspartate/glutamate racemase family protein [Pseudomonas quercus]